MGKKFIIAIVLLLQSFATTTAIAATTSVKVYCPCQYHAPLVLAPTKHAAPIVIEKPVTTTYVINTTVPYVRRPDPNEIANAYYAQHQYVNTYSYCNYYGYDCVNPSAQNNYSYIRQPDPNDIANAYYASQPSYYFPNTPPYDYYPHRY